MIGEKHHCFHFINLNNAHILFRHYRQTDFNDFAKTKKEGFC